MKPGNVRLWHLADITIALPNARFWGQSGHDRTRTRRCLDRNDFRGPLGVSGCRAAGKRGIVVVRRRRESVQQQP